MGSKKRVLSDSQKAEYAANKRRKRDADKLLSKQWRVINLDKESFLLSRSNVSERSPTFNFRSASLLSLFLSFVMHGLATQIAQDLSPDELQYKRNKSIHLSLPCIDKMLAIWIRIYGEQHQSIMGVRKGERLNNSLSITVGNSRLLFRIRLLLEELVSWKSLRLPFF